MSLLLPDAGLLFWMLLAFGVVFVVLYKFGFPIITSMIDARKQYIDEALKKAKEANEKIANIEQQCNGLIEEARQRQVEILREATAAKEQIIREAREKADAETAKIVAEAKREIEQQRQDALNSLRNEAATVAIAVSEKILRKQLEGKDSQQEYIERLVDEAQNELKADKGK
ncbi:MAG: F0F1 ATP synthase subunit B [Bacteroidaceae bacterium]|nr:F0F1 ATP synthase subunit B [Bacteroidaceae bacterium]